MSNLDFITQFHAREAQPDIRKANWYTVGAVALTAANAGHDVKTLYRLATEGLLLEDEKIVQRRLKEAILKTSPLYGLPRAIQALFPLFQALPDEAIDHYGPRYNSPRTKEMEELRSQRGRKYFDTFWTPEAAESGRELLLKYQPDLYLICQQWPYEMVFSDDAILSPVETQMCNVAALVCSNSPRQALWHTRGVVRHGGSIEQAKFAQDLALAAVEALDCKIGHITKVEEIDFEGTEM